MASSLYNKKTLLNAFVSIAHSVDVERVAVECGQAQWTYGELDVVSSGLARDMYKAYGAKPTVAIVCENHPYTLAMLFAIWKLGGIVAPLDHNVPKDIMERMLTNIGPTCVLVPSTERVTQSIIEGISLKCHTFDSEATTITALIQKYLDQSPELPGHQFPPPSPEDIALYLHTSRLLLLPMSNASRSATRAS
ncbi:hypothetical protein BJ912DRAFT_112548 [Pholiota molesta]|nr:hypothetical protein BJ912DRAFT_112548 [Pholiota molesta]